MGASTRMFPAEVHRCPPVAKALHQAPSTARSRSASRMTTSGFFPPSSRVGRMRFLPATSPIQRPTLVEPVKANLLRSPSSMSSTSHCPVESLPPPKTRLITPGGRPASSKSLTKM